MSETHAPGPGEDCALCKRRVPHPRRDETPATKTRSYRVPVDEVEAHKEVLDAAAKFLGTYQRPYHVFQTLSLALYCVLQDESLRGFAQREPA